MVFDHTIFVRSAPEAIFPMLADPQDFAPARLVPVLRKAPGGPTQAGTRWQEEVRFGPWRIRTRSLATSVERPRQLSMRWEGPFMHGDLSYTLEAMAGGTMLRQRETMVPEGPLRLFGGLVGRSLTRHLIRRMEDIRNLAERRSSTS